MPAPTLVSYVETVWNTTGANKSLPVTSWLNGDLIVVASLTEDFACTVTVANQFGLTFTSTTTGTAGSTCFAGVFTATATSDQTSVAVAAVSADGGVNTHAWGVGLWVFRGPGGVGTPVVDKTTAKTISLTRVAANSMVVSAAGDFSAAASTGYSFTPTVGHDRQHAAFTPYTIYVADWGDQGSTGTTSYGTTGETSSGTFAKVAVEVKGIAGSAAAPGAVAALYGPGWHPGRGLPGEPGGTPFYAPPSPSPVPVPPLILGTPGPVMPPMTWMGGPGKRPAPARARVGPLANVTGAGEAGPKPAVQPAVYQRVSGYARKVSRRPIVGPRGRAAGGIAAPAATPAAAAPPLPRTGPVQARLLPRRGGSVTSRDGVYGQTGPPVTPADGPARARIPQPVRGGQVTRRTGTFGGVGPAVKALASAVAGKLRGLPARGRTAGRSGVYGQLGPAVKPATGPVQAHQLPRRGGSTQSRTGTYTAVVLGAGPPIYPLGHPVQARRQPARGGRVTRAAGVYGGTGPPVKAPAGPVKAQPAPRRGGTVASRAGTLTSGVPQAGPTVYPLGHPVQARRQPLQGGRVVRRAGTYAQTGPPVKPQQGPIGVSRRQPPPPTRGRVASQRGPYGQTGPPTIPLRRPVRGQPQRPVLTGRSRWRAGTYTAPIVAPFTVGALSAADKPTAVLVASGTTSTLTAATAPSGALTAGDKRTGGPG
jgi:hypothetical protein